ncbi:LADA_0G14598g1_1 [Lachancea dasiensis]|uniref:LADA_0G14598g1_1 n=1 Tax=Lachancea dasiensis TaxID=1072105 RepID=A0A1G4JW90_9SACH|nr:LADA_0G14598g1_1 [Lachancea dasiensis]
MNPPTVHNEHITAEPPMVKKKKSSVSNESTKRVSVSNAAGLAKNSPHLSLDANSSKDIQEKILLALFTTRPGQCTLKLYYELSCGHVNLHQYKKWQSAKHGQVIEESYKTMVRKWTESPIYICMLMDFFLRNEQVPLDYTKFTLPNYKLSLSFLLFKDTELLIIDENYNILLDFLVSCRPTIEQLLNTSYLPMSLISACHSNRRLYQLNGQYTWFSLAPHSSKHPREIIYNYLTVLTDKLTAQQELIPQLEHLLSGAILDKITPFVGKHHSHIDAVDSDSNSDSDNWPAKKDYAQDRVYSFDLNDEGMVETLNVFSQTRKRHQTLYQVLKLPEQSQSPLLKSQFFTICALVDPVTQPIPNDSHIVSIDLISELFLGLLSNDVKDLSPNWRFHLCFNLQKIINATLPRLNCDDFQRLNSVNNSDESVDWRRNLHKWLPQGLNTQDLELIYMVDILAIYLIYKLYRDIPIQMNPFLAPMISLWKNLTFVVLLGLEIDRFEEEQETFSTPVIVRATIRGASALRSVVATVLNGHVDYKRHDFQHEPINIFMSPHGRKLCHGALYTDVRSHAAAMLALGIELEDVTNLLSDLQPGDRFDEDVKYMFDYEYDNYNEVDAEDIDEDDLEDVESRERIKEMRAYYKRCHCQFDDDELLPEGADDPELLLQTRTNPLREAPPESNNRMSSLASTAKPMARRSKKEGIDFDFNGRDWRDIPRGLNFYFSENFTFTQHITKDALGSLMTTATERSLTFVEGRKLLQMVGTCVAREQQQAVFRSVFAGGPEQEVEDHYALVADGDLTTDYVYEKWCEDSHFERMLLHNETLVWRLIDEVLMCSGYRRVLIWFITHLEISSSMIEYIYSLVMGERGEVVLENAEGIGEAQDPYTQVPFSRQGPIQLSEIEVKMLLQEFFTNVAIFFSKHARECEEASEDEEGGQIGQSGIPPRVVGLMKLMCMMVKKLMAEDKFDFRDPDYIFELQTLLMSWICFLPEARDLLFDLRSLVDQKLPDVENPARSHDDTVVNNADPVPFSEIVDHDGNVQEGNFAESGPGTETSISVYNKRLISLLPPIAGSENTAVTALRSFISKHSLTMKTAVLGRRVVSQDDEIMGMYMSDREMDNRHFLAEFGIEYNDFVDGVYDNDYEYE